MKRLPDWEERLHAYLDGCADKLFGYDHDRDPMQLDCCMFAAGAVIALTDEDPASEFRGKYRSAASASRALRTYGAGTLPQTLDAKFEGRPVAFARRGDLVMVDDAVGVCIGADAVFLGEEGSPAGLVRRARSDWAHCWAVG